MANPEPYTPVCTKVQSSELRTFGLKVRVRSSGLRGRVSGSGV